MCAKKKLGMKVITTKNRKATRYNSRKFLNLLVNLFNSNVSDRDVGPNTISDTFPTRTLHHPCPLKME